MYYDAFHVGIYQKIQVGQMISCNYKMNFINIFIKILKISLKLYPNC